MASAISEQDRNWLWPMVMVAVVVHGLLFLIVLPQRDISRPHALVVEWLELEPLIPPEPETVDHPALEQEQEQEQPPAPVPEPLAQTSPDSGSEPLAEAPADIPKTSPATPSAERLRELALIAARAQVETAAPSSPGTQGFAVPRLPSQAGWLNDYVGPVNARVDRWREADGTQAMRVVTASGQVYCGRARALTASEEFNPWKSTALMYWRLCGREQPEPIDRSNPWVRGNGSARD